MFLGNVIDLFVFNLTTGLPLAGDAANITGYLSIDDAAPVALTNGATEIDSVASKGWYKIALTTAERIGTKFLFTGVSATTATQVVAVPATYLSADSGGGVLNARIAYSSLAPDNFLLVVQGEEKILTFIVEADGRFDETSANLISVKLKDPSGNTVTKLNSTINRVTEESDIQVFRTTLSPSDTNALGAGLLRIEVAFDSQKAVLTHTLKVVESL